MIPRQTCDEIECMVRRFIWGTTNVGWDFICQPKWCGGLGMRQLRDQNITFLLKLGYKLVSDDEVLWVRVLKSKYGVNNFLPISIEKHIQDAKGGFLEFQGRIMEGSVENFGPAKSSFLFLDCAKIENPHQCGKTWRLWKNRNLSIFQMKSWSSNEIIKVSMCWAKHAYPDSKNESSDYTVSPHKEPTSKDWIYLNVDGAISRTSERAAIGGVIRDSKGNWIMGYNRFLGNCSIFDAKLCGILDGLKLIQHRENGNVIIQSDSLEVVKAIHENVSKNSSSALLRRIHRILSQERQWILRYTPREENKSADYLSKLAFEREEDFHLIESPPDEILVYLEADKEGIFVPRGISL
ncbi:hypothetical protein PVK06_047470 [Gossypium arboreum]|uniref:RNase H type-1 domain-containing protein n=1 Tax=Gossypium arboreum TaxID=29729 RepID=A0ABR0MDE2_GOSAR|nr:hypothetical protein PVK06_047470 [Gossypium arboreum]